jgi:hypothetical protein
MSNIDEIIEEHCNILEEILKNQQEIIENQERLIETLKASVKITEISRDYWVNEYYKLAEELIIMKYYTCARTSGGFADFTPDNLADVERKIMLDKRSVKDTDRILSYIQNKVGECEKILTPGYEDLKCGLIFRNKGVAVLCENTGDIGDEKHTLMYKCFGEAKKIHDEWEKIYIQNTDYTRLNSFGEDICRKIIAGYKSESGRSVKYKRFFGTLTENGAVNYIDELTSDVQKRYFIKGRPGTGKSTFLKRLSADAISRGFDVEEYYCSFDKNSLDMVVIRELSVCVFDSTPPHEKFPEYETDEILDFYENSGLAGIDESLKETLSDIKERYDTKMAEGKAFLKEILRSERELSEKTAEPDYKLKGVADKILNLLT